MIKFNETYKSKNIKKYINDLIGNNGFSNNYFRDKCSEYIKKEFGYEYFLLTHSATAALEMSAMLLGKNTKYKNSTVFMPSYTFSSTANAFMRSNFKINFLDIDPENMMIQNKKIDFQPNDIFVPVHYAGSYFDFDKFFQFNSKKITIVEDAAQAFGVKYNNQQAGLFGRFSCFSFHPTKNIHSGFGGMIVFKYKSDFELAKSIYERGTDRNKVVSGQKNKYEWVSLGSSFELNELSSAVLLSQLEDINEITEIKKRNFYRYISSLNNLIEYGLISIQNIPDKVSSNYHSFYILLKENNNDFIRYLYKNKIQSYIGYSPLHNSQYGKKNGLYNQLKNTERTYKRLVRLPSHANLKLSEIDYICKTIQNYFKK